MSSKKPIGLVVGGLASDDELVAIRAAIDVASPVELEGLVQEAETTKDRTFGIHHVGGVAMWQFAYARLDHRPKGTKGKDNEVLHGPIKMP